MGEALVRLVHVAFWEHLRGSTPRCPWAPQAHLLHRGSPPVSCCLSVQVLGCYPTLPISCRRTPCFVGVSKALLAFFCHTVPGGWREAGPAARTPCFPTLCCCPAWQSSHGGWAGTQPRKPGLSWLSLLSPSRGLSQTGLNEQLLHRQWARSHSWLLALSTQTRLTEAMTGSTGFLTRHVAWYGLCEALIVKASQVFTAFGLKTELYERRT